MAVYLTTAAAALFYALNLPIRFAFTLNIGDENLLRVGVGLFQARYIIEKRFELSGEKARATYQKVNQNRSGSVMRAGLGSARHFIRHARFPDARMSIRLGVGDAALTALICGTFQILLQALNMSGVIRLPARVTPDFSHQRLTLSAGGMVHVRLGHIIGAALVFVRELVSGRIKQWTDIQLRVS